MKPSKAFFNRGLEAPRDEGEDSFEELPASLKEGKVSRLERVISALEDLGYYEEAELLRLYLKGLTSKKEEPDPEEGETIESEEGDGRFAS